MNSTAQLQRMLGVGDSTIFKMQLAHKYVTGHADRIERAARMIQRNFRGRRARRLFKLSIFRMMVGSHYIPVGRRRRRCSRLNSKHIGLTVCCVWCTPVCVDIRLTGVQVEQHIGLTVFVYGVPRRVLVCWGGGAAG